MNDLAQMKCVSYQEKEEPLNQKQIDEYKPMVPNWQVVEYSGIHQLERIFSFNDFNQALSFTMKVGILAEAEAHHPSITTEWGKVTVTWWTHKVKGLHKNDFIMAAKTDVAYNNK